MIGCHSPFHNLRVYFCSVTFFKILEVSWIILFVVVAAEDQFCRSVFMVMKFLQAWTSKQIREAAKNTPRGGVHKMGGQQLSLKMGEGQPLSWKMVKGQSLSWKMWEWQPPSWEMGRGSTTLMKNGARDTVISKKLVRCARIWPVFHNIPSIIAC